MTSRPLFISVAESVVIFAPMLQLGWFRASATVTSASFSTGQSRNDPPEAVRMIRRMPPSGRPWRHWKMAECSESAGRILTPCFSANGSTAGPPAMRVSLFARQMSLPASIAATCREGRGSAAARGRRVGRGVGTEREKESGRAPWA